MIKRIVKLTFRPELVPEFMLVFEQSKHHIRAFEGCKSMMLLRDATQPNVLFTLSEWDDLEALESYRKSDLFQSTWAKTKVLFAEKPSAWSTEVLDAG